MPRLTELIRLPSVWLLHVRANPGAARQDVEITQQEHSEIIAGGEEAIIALITKLQTEFRLPSGPWAVEAGGLVASGEVAKFDKQEPYLAPANTLWDEGDRIVLFTEDEFIELKKTEHQIIKEAQGYTIRKKDGTELEKGTLIANEWVRK